jgi:pimeloyl-ACP methyl ester carboxylesterase
MLKNSEEICFNYEKIGSGKKKIVCIHGLGASGKTFYDILPYFDDDYEIYLIDLVGFGDTPFVENWDYTIESQARLLYKFLKKKGLDKVTLIGHSYGGGVALLLLIILTELMEESLVESLVLIGPACYPQKFPFFLRFPCEKPLLYKIFMFLIPKKVLAITMLKKIYVNKDAITKEKIARYASFNKYGNNVNGIIHTVKNILPKNHEIVIEKIKHINVRTLIIWGDQDFVIKKKHILRLHQDLLDSELVIVENAGHVVHEEKADVVFKAIDNFLEG